MIETPTDAAECCTTLAGILAGYWDVNGDWSTENEEGFRSAFADARMGVFRVRPAGIIHDCNERAAEILGYARRELIGRPLSSMHPRTERGSRKAARLFRKFTSGEGFCGELLEMTKRDGQVVTVVRCTIPLLGSDGEVKEGISTIELA